MSKFRRAAKVDVNQPSIVKGLRNIPGITVETGKDDILIGYCGKTFWIEIKSDLVVSSKTGLPWPSSLKDSQKKLLSEWTGHYAVCSNLDQILIVIGVIK